MVFSGIHYLVVFSVLTLVLFDGSLLGMSICLYMSCAYCMLLNLLTLSAGGLPFCGYPGTLKHVGLFLIVSIYLHYMFHTECINSFTPPLEYYLKCKSFSRLKMICWYVPVH